jgi:hypothetical protein
VTVAVAVAVVVFGVGVPGAAFSTGSADRSSSVDVVDDPDGVAALNVTTTLQEGTSGQCLVKVTNNAGRDVTVNVSLREDSRDLGELQRESGLLGTQTGDSLEFSLADGGTETVNMNANDGTAGNTTYFHVTTTASGLNAQFENRSAPIEQSAGTTCG